MSQIGKADSLAMKKIVSSSLSIVGALSLVLGLSACGSSAPTRAETIKTQTATLKQLIKTVPAKNTVEVRTNGGNSENKNGQYIGCDNGKTQWVTGRIVFSKGLSESFVNTEKTTLTNQGYTTSWYDDKAGNANSKKLIANKDGYEYWITYVKTTSKTLPADQAIQILSFGQCLPTNAK
jgi:uncharacterized lipoprotein YehR (DUF1307 family)